MNIFTFFDGKEFLLIPKQGNVDYRNIKAVLLKGVLLLQIVTHQQRIFMILNSLRIPYTAIDIAAPGQEEETDSMRANAKKKDGQRHVLPPQIFNGEKYCGVSMVTNKFYLKEL